MADSAGPAVTWATCLNSLRQIEPSRLQIAKWFRFLLWSTQRRIGHLSPYAMMDHCGFIMAHGRELRVYRRLLT